MGPGRRAGRPRLYDRARDLRLPVVVATRTGGARLQEGMVALVQLARTAAASRHARAGLPSSLGLRSLTTGGVYASYGSLADIRAAVEHADRSAGPRVAEAALDEAFCRPLAHRRGGVRRGAGRRDQAPHQAGTWVDVALGSPTVLPTRLRLVAAPAAGGAWGEVLRARALGRPTGIDRAARLSSSWLERGAPIRWSGPGWPRWPAGGAWWWRRTATTAAAAPRRRVPAGAAGRRPGRATRPAAGDAGGHARCGPVAGVGGRRHRRRDRPHVRGHGRLPDPHRVGVRGRGWQRGALALSYADRLLISEHAIFTVIAPEGAAAILERDAAARPRWRHAEAQVVRPPGLGLADEVIAEGQSALDEAVARALDAVVVGEREGRFDGPQPGDSSEAEIAPERLFDMSTSPGM